jgi:periplasmic protein TonB
MPKGTRTSATVTPLITARKKPVARPHALVVHTEARTMSLPFLFGDATPGKRLLFKAIVASVLLHLAALAVHFSPLDLVKFDRNGPPLEIALVNAKSVSKPTKAELLAQAHLDGGGNTDANRRAKSPLPVLPKESASTRLATATQKVDTLEQRASEMMAQLKTAAPVAVPQPQPNEAAERTDLPTATELMQRTLESMRLEAQIAKDMDAYQKRPKRRLIGARAEEYRFARYVEDWRLKVERIGNFNYPEAARAQKLYGSLLLTTGIRADGSIESIVVERSSGKRVLDMAAAHIVQMGGPYSPFPPDIRRDTDILYITRTWTFAPGDSLTSQ